MLGNEKVQHHLGRISHLFCYIKNTPFNTKKGFACLIRLTKDKNKEKKGWEAAGSLSFPEKNCCCGDNNKDYNHDCSDYVGVKGWLRFGFWNN